MSKYCLHPLKNLPSLKSFSPNSSGPTPTSATPLALRSGSSLLISVAIHRHTWQPNLRRKNKTTGWSCHRDWSSTLWNRQRGQLTVKSQIRWHTGNIWEMGVVRVYYSVSVFCEIDDREYIRFKQSNIMIHIHICSLQIIIMSSLRSHLTPIISMLWGNGRFNTARSQQENTGLQGEQTARLYIKREHLWTQSN